MAILHKAECCLGWEISCEEIEQGQLQELLIADDYTASSEVSKVKSCYYMHYYLLFQQSNLMQLIQMVLKGRLYWMVYKGCSHITTNLGPHTAQTLMVLMHSFIT